jgi:hypothetical protein
MEPKRRPSIGLAPSIVAAALIIGSTGARGQTAEEYHARADAGLRSLLLHF